MNTNLKTIFFFSLSLVLFSCFDLKDPNDLAHELTGIHYSQIPQEKIKFLKFDSCENLGEYYEIMIEKERETREAIESGPEGSTDVLMTDNTPMGTAEASDSLEYTDTNVQVEGVDEADIVKTDGNYIYVINNNKLIILLAFPAESARKLSEISLTGSPVEMFLYNDTIVVFEIEYPSYYTSEEAFMLSSKEMDTEEYLYGGSNLLVEIIDVSDRENPGLLREISIDGDYQSSRDFEDKLHFIVQKTVDMYALEKEPEKIQEILDDVDCEMVYKPKEYNPTSIVSIFSLNLNDINSDLVNVSALANGGIVYASHNSIFLADQNYYYRDTWDSTETSDIHKFDISEGVPLYMGSNTIKGSVLNQFSMDEHEGFFRVASTQGHAVRIWDGEEPTSESFLTILDSGMNIISAISGLGMSERIYSARFIGERGFIVTFRKVDPLYTIDLSDPYNPQVKGALKITGYSDYIHPLGENHLLTIGKEADEEGFYQGVALSIFDITDLSNPILSHREDIGVRGTDSSALYNHKAFTFFASKGILSIPIQIHEYTDGVIEDCGWGPCYGDLTFNGAIVLKVDPENGFSEMGRVDHSDMNTSSNLWDNTIERTIMIEEALYTLSNIGIKINYLGDFDILAKIMF